MGTVLFQGKLQWSFAGRVISYLLGEKLTQEEETELRVSFKDLPGNEGPASAVLLDQPPVQDHESSSVTVASLF